MARRPGDLNPNTSVRHFFGAELRHWRERRGLSQATLGKTVHVSPDLIAKVEKATRWPTPSLVARCEDVLKTGGVLLRLLQLLEHQRGTQDRISASDISSLVTSGTPYLVVIPAGAGDHPAQIVVSTRPAGGQLAAVPLTSVDQGSADLYHLQARPQQRRLPGQKLVRPA